VGLKGSAVCDPVDLYAVCVLFAGAEKDVLWEFVLIQGKRGVQEPDIPRVEDHELHLLSWQGGGYVSRGNGDDDRFPHDVRWLVRVRVVEIGDRSIFGVSGGREENREGDVATGNQQERFRRVYHAGDQP